MTTDADSRILAARRITAHVAELLQADLSLRLWNGEVLPLGPNARDDIQIVVARPSAIRRVLLKPGLMTLFELFGTGDLRIEGGSPHAHSAVVLRAIWARDPPTITRALLDEKYDGDFTRVPIHRIFIDEAGQADQARGVDDLCSGVRQRGADLGDHTVGD